MLLAWYFIPGNIKRFLHWCDLRAGGDPLNTLQRKTVHATHALLRAIGEEYDPFTYLTYLTHKQFTLFIRDKSTTRKSKSLSLCTWGGCSTNWAKKHPLQYYFNRKNNPIRVTFLSNGIWFFFLCVIWEPSSTAFCVTLCVWQHWFDKNNVARESIECFALLRQVIHTWNTPGWLGVLVQLKVC